MDEVLASSLVGNESYKLLVGSVVPRPIAWVVTMSETGTRNIAPFSFFNVASPNPPTLSFSVSPSARIGVEVKDTLSNLRASGVCTVNIASSSLLTDFLPVASEYGPEVDEFVVCGIAAEPSKLVAVPRMADAPIAMECEVTRYVPVGSHTLVLCQVLLWRFAPGLREEFNISTDRLSPLGRLGGPRFSVEHREVEAQAPRLVEKQGMTGDA